ncbi:MAG TPA: 1,2-phenylacetyl-CoA epoxidase subunit PaaC [Candidatus Dormibacteraeota bacterium]|nr:1,2-phenylacetyl-CoA epoxidase subunit PaaC [Candidatus Dormibacteraeota bacterium]
MTDLGVAGTSLLCDYTLGIGDDCLILSHRLSEWAARAPDFEEDVALANLALDLLGQARSLLAYAGELERSGRSEDDLAYWRDDRQFRNLLLVEQPNGDFALTITRHLLFSTHQVLLYGALAQSSDATIRGIAAKGVMEARYHQEHAALWTLRLGDGTAESHARMERALLELWPLTGEMFQLSPGLSELVVAGVAVNPSNLQPPWESQIGATLQTAALEIPAVPQRRCDGRFGIHSEHLGHLLAEMQHLHRSHPDAVW